MLFNLIDKKTWKRTPYFDHFLNNTRCTYNLTTKLDITYLLPNIKSNNIKLYPTLIYITSKVVNSHEELRTSFDSNGNLGFWDVINPCYTIFHKDNETFSNVWTKYCDNFSMFYNNYIDDMKQYGDIKKFYGKDNQPDNVFPVSCNPWISFTGYNLNVFDNDTYLLPIFTYGKYFKENGKIFIPISLQIHHAICDGYHASRCINEIQKLCYKFSKIKDFKNI